MNVSNGLHARLRPGKDDDLIKGLSELPDSLEMGDVIRAGCRLWLEMLSNEEKIILMPGSKVMENEKELQPVKDTTKNKPSLELDPGSAPVLERAEVSASVNLDDDLANFAEQFKTG